MGKRIVLIGAGYSGILTAKKLAKRLKKNDAVSITVIDRNPFHTMLTELHEVAAGRVDEDSVKISLARVFARRKIDFVLDTVASVDFAQKRVLGKNGTYDYDYLVLAAGSRPTFFGVSGAKEYAYKLWSYDDAVRLKEHILDCFRRAARETDPEEKKRLLCFYVVGAGFTGVETVGEIAEYLPVLCDKFEIDRPLVTVYDVDILPRTVPTLPEKLSGKIERRLAQMGVTTMLNTGVVGIGPDFIEMKSGDEVLHKPAGTVIWTAGIESAEITAEAAKTLSSAKRGRIETDQYLRSVDNKDVFVAGDNIFYTSEGETAPVPQLVENCEQSASVIANNIVCAVSGSGEWAEYRPKFHGVMVCVGGRYGVARVGGSKHKINLPSFFAMFVKHFINVIYFIQVLGWNKVFSYAKHEFFTIRNNRSFLGGHFSNKTPSFLLVALRMWLGAVWVYEGVMKIVEGWFAAPKLPEFFNSANQWFSSILFGAPAGADAVSSATTAAGASAGQTLLNFNFIGLFQVILVSGKDLAHSTLNDIAFRLDVPLINWFVNTLVLPHPGFQMFMQISIVLAEILIGLALLGGLFTTPASALSLVLQAMFVATTGLYLGTFWMIFAGVAVLIGGGRIFGFDYYVMPFLKKHWKNVGFVRKLYIYND